MMVKQQHDDAVACIRPLTTSSGVKSAVMDGAALLRGDVLADEDYGQKPEEVGLSGSFMLARPPTSSKPSTPASPRLALRQSNSFAARKRLERLQFGGIALANNGSLAGSANTSAAASPVARTLPPGADALFSSSTFGSLSVSGGGAVSSSSGDGRGIGCQGGGSGSGGGLGSSMDLSAVTVGASTATAIQHERQQQQHGSEAERQLAALGLAPVYDPTGGVMVAAAAAAAAAAAVAPSSGGKSGNGKAGRAQLPPPARVRFTDTAAFLLEPGPRDRTVQCVVVREKDSVAGGKCHRYQLFLDDPEGGPRRFVAAARRRRGRAASVYDITSSPAAGGAARYAPGFAGKLRANFLGTEFVLTDAGAKPGAAASGNNNNDGNKPPRAGSVSSGQAQQPPALRRELAAVSYEPNLLGATGPRRMLVVVPAVAPPAGGADGGGRLGVVTSSSSTSSNGGGVATPGPLLNRLRAIAAANAASRGDVETGNNAGTNHQQQQQHKAPPRSAPPPPPADLAVLRNKAPRWNEALQAFCLNFGGRVTVASVKNFQLVADGGGSGGGGEGGSEGEDLVMQFGKASDDTFTCDFRWPLCALQAFALCLSSFDGKLACE